MSLRHAATCLLLIACTTASDESAGERGPLGKADGAGSCVGHCGEQSDATCWCDAQCASFGDCCADKPAVCDGSPAGFISIDAGVHHTCALRADGSAVCWGLDNSGQTTAPAGTFTKISADRANSCALDTAGKIVCWGGAPQPPQGEFTAITTGGFSNQPEVCGVRKSDGHVICRGSEFTHDLTFHAYTSVAMGVTKICAVRTTGEVDCRGRDTSSPTLLFKSYSVSTANFLSRECGVRDDGTLHCLLRGEIPTGTFESVVVGPTNACAIRTDGTLVCWGNDDRGQSTPPAGTFIGVGVGEAHACAIRSNGSIACWGANDHGQATPPS